MKVTNFRSTVSKETITYSADFFIETIPGNRIQRWKLRFRNLLSNYLHSVDYKMLLHVKQTVWFTLPIEEASHAGATDTFFLIAAGLSFLIAEDLDFSAPVSPDLLSTLQALRAYCDYGQLRKNLSLQVEVGKPFVKMRSGSVQTFTLGVDSFATLLLREISGKPSPTLLYVEGYDVPLIQRQLLEKIRSNIQAVAKVNQTSALFMRSNLREISDAYIGWGQFHVIAIVAAARLLHFKHLLLPGETFEWSDWGLRKEVESVFSTIDFSVRLAHHAVPRTTTISKLLRHSHSSLFLKYVRVCWINVMNGGKEYNCSVCQKCLRTALSIQLLGMSTTPTFAKIKIGNISNLTLNPHIFKEWQILYLLSVRKFGKSHILSKTIAALLKKPLNIIAHGKRKFSM